MANPIPCQVCGEIEDADFMVTARSMSSQALFQAVTQAELYTLGICMDCLIGLMQAVEVARNQDTGPEPAGPEPEPAEPEVKGDGDPEPFPEGDPPPEAEGEQVGEETEAATADVDG